MSEAFGEVDEGSIRSEIRGGADNFKAREATTMTSEDTSASDPIQLHRDHPWLTAAELAAEVGCSERTIYRRVSRGEIERLETGDGARFRVPRLSREVSVTVSQKGLSVTSSELTDSLSDPVVVEVDGGVSHPVSHCQSPCQSPCQSSVSDTLSVTGRPGAVNLELVRLVGELSRELSEATREAGMWKERCAGAERDRERLLGVVGDLTTEMLDLDVRLALALSGASNEPDQAGSDH